MRLQWVFLLVIVILAGVLRFYGIAYNPPGLYSDELSIGYNAYSILKTGKDEHGKFLPIDFKAFGEHKLPVYIYLTAISIKFFGLNEFAVRFPSAAFGVATVLLTYFLVKNFSINKKYNTSHLALISTFFLAISPWHLQFSRGGFEANVALFFITLGLLLWLKNSQWKQYFGTVSFILAMYTYNSARVFVPGFLALFLFARWKQGKISRNTILKNVLFAIVLLLPLAPTIFSGNAFIRSADTSAFVESASRFPAPWIAISYVFTWLANISSYVSPLFLFFSGDGFGRHGIREMGQLYLFELPLILFGFLIIVRGKWNFEKTILMLWLFMAALPASLSRPSPHALRSLFMVIPFHIMSALGLVVISQKLKRLKSTIISYSSFVLISGVILYSGALYLRFYWFHYPLTVAIDWKNGHKELFTYLQSIDDSYDTVTVSNWYGPEYISALFYLAYDPDTYYNEAGNSEGFGKYTFAENAPESKEGERSLIVYPANIDAGAKKIHSINFINGDVAFDVWEL